MTHPARSICALAAVILAASVWAGDGDRSVPKAPELEPVTRSVSALDLEKAARARKIELESTKAFGGASPLVIPAAAFTTNGNYDDTYYFQPFDGAMSGWPDTDGCVQAPAYLPRSARVFQVYASILDEDAGAVDGMAVMSTTGSSENMQTPYESDPTYPVIDYPVCAYWLTVRLCSTDHKLYGAMIFY